MPQENSIWFNKTYLRGGNPSTSNKMSGFRSRLFVSTALTLSCVMGGLSVGVGTAVAQQETSQDKKQAFSIPVQALVTALDLLADQADISFAYKTADLAKLKSSDVSGILTVREALQKILAGTGLVARFTSAKAVIVELAGTEDNNGVIRLGPVRVEGSDLGVTSDPVVAPYRTPGATAYIGQQEISHFRGSNPSDILRGTPGVMSGDPRNSGSALDVNVRGMQGMGRVNVIIDGAMNNTTIYQGYQGVGNRSFVDPDFIAGVDITKGSDVSSRGIAGTVSMRTLEAGDIVDEGNNWGARIKVEFGGNTSTPVAGDTAGYLIKNNVSYDNFGSVYYEIVDMWFPALQEPKYSEITVSDDTMNRPGFLDMTQGAASAIVAYQDEQFEFLVGMAQRSRGNYHAGEKGGTPAALVDLGEQPHCYLGECQEHLYYTEFYENIGDTNFRAGEQVLNTELETTSILAKATVKIGDGHAVQFSYMGFESEAGDRLASRLTGVGAQAIQQKQTVGTELRTMTLKYFWQPVDNDLINLKANVWDTHLERRNSTRLLGASPSEFDLPDDYRVGSNTDMFGFDLTNTSKLDTNFGTFDLVYGLFFLNQDTKPSAYTEELQLFVGNRDGDREEQAIFLKAGWKANDWLTLNAGLRYQKYSSQDRTAPAENRYDTQTYGQSTSASGWNPSIGITVEPWKDTQFYVTYSNAQRMPSMFEALTGFSTKFNPDLKPERSENWEIGINATRGDLLADGDRGMLKFGYFNWDVTDYIARELRDDFYSAELDLEYASLIVYNTDRAKFSGLELSMRYGWKGFSADFAANYYLNVAFCKTADTCEDKSLYGDYATNQIPPEYSLSLSLSQKLFEDSLTLGGRIEYIGERAIGHGEVTAQGASSFISLIDWKPYALVDVFVEYKFNENLTGAIRIENLMDKYYVDPLGLVNEPSPGRTMYFAMTVDF